MIEFQKELKELQTELKIKGFSNRTIKTYIFQNQKFLEFVNNPKYESEFQKTLLSKGSKRTPEDITMADIRAYLAFLTSDKALSPNSVNLAISALKFLYNKILEKDLFSKVEYQKTPKKLPVVLTKDEIGHMIDLTKNKKHKLLLELLYSTGMRVNEAVNLRIRDILYDEKKAFVKYGKGQRERFVPLSNRLIKHLKSYIKRRKKGSIYVFCSRNGPLTTRQAQRIVKIAAKRAGIQKKVFCHAFRSSFATHLLATGHDIRAIQELLGHQFLDTTQKYTKVMPDQFRKIRNPLDSL